MSYVPPVGEQAALEFTRLRYIPPTGNLLALDFRALPVYTPPTGHRVALSFVNYVPPSGNKAALEFVPGGEPTPGDDQYIFPQPFDAAGYGAATLIQSRFLLLDGIAPLMPPDGAHVELLRRYLTPPSIRHVNSYGRPLVRNWNEQAWPPGFSSQAFGTNRIENTARQIRVNGLVASAYGSPTAWNWLQYRSAQGFNASSYGRAYVQGGVKTIIPSGRNLAGYGRPLLINTTADQSVTAKGVQWPGSGKPNVSPRMVYPPSIYGTAISGPLVQFPPRPQGWVSSRVGDPEIDFWTTFVEPQGLGTGEIIGYPKVFDPTRRVYPGLVLGTGVFGDVSARNLSVFVRPEGLYAFEGSDWAEFRSNRRYVPAAGFDALLSGETSIRNKTPSIIPDGVEPLTPVSQFIAFRIRYIYGRGSDQLATGTAKVTQPPSISPAGMAGLTGSPTVWHRIRTLFASGKNADLHGTPSIWFRYRHIEHEGKDQGTHGKPLIEHGRRYLLALGSQLDRHGRPMLSNADRQIEPKSIFTEFATGHMVGGTRSLLPIGFDAARFGTRVIPPITTVYPLGFTGLYGQALAYNSLQTVQPDSVKWVQPADRWGKGSIWNLRQYITMYFDPDSQLNPPRWPQWTAIENRTKNLRTTGQNAARIGDQQVFNAARPILPEGIDGLTINESSMVAMRYRPLRIEGMEAPYISSWSVIANDAAVVEPTGPALQESGSHSVVNTRRYYNRVGGYESARLGYPMVADRIRTLAIEKRYTIDAPRIDLPNIKLYTRYMDGIGYDASGIGLASLSIHWTLITPRWTLRNDFGYPALRNVTPELGTRGRASDEFGDTHVRLEWRPVSLDGALTSLFGRSIIAYRDRVVTAQGIQSLMFGDKLTVIKTGAPPYSLQTISLDEYIDQAENKMPGFGIDPDKDSEGRVVYQVPEPVMNQMVVYVIQEDESTLFGDALVESNVIRVNYGYHEPLHGKTRISLKVRSLIVDKFPSGEVFEPSKPRLSPHTVYAVMEAPSQAKANHPTGTLHYVDGYRRTPGAAFGYPNASLRDRSIRPSGIGLVKYVMQPPIMSLGTNYIAPSSIRSYRTGFHSIPGTQYAVQIKSGDTAAYGRPTVARYIPPGEITVPARGFLAEASGRHAVDHFDRQLLAKGYDASRMGTRNGNDTPYMWQGLRVGPLMPTIPEGTDQSLPGEPWVTMRVREAMIQGFDAFISEYQLEAFAQRMRVANTYRPMPEEQEINAAGFALDQTGTPDIKRAVHYIRPDGNANQYRKGAF